MFKISVIIPCYNVSLFIDRCLTSIVNQTIGIDNLQIICVDDASTDDTWQCLQRWEQQYPDHIVLIHLDTNSRQGTCRNIGMEYVTAPWVTFIDADDWVEPDYCEIMYAYADGLDCDVVRCNIKRDSSTTLVYFQNRETDISDQFLLIDTIEKRKRFMSSHMLGHTACDKLVRTSLLMDQHIFFAENIAYEEIPWHTLLHAYATKIFIVGNILYHYFTNPLSTTASVDAVHYTDILTSSLCAWQNWINHNLFTTYKNELEYDFIFYGYLFFLKKIIFSHNPSYSFYLLSRDITLTHVPYYADNPYLSTCNTLDRYLICLLDTPMNRIEFQNMISQAKQQIN